MQALNNTQWQTTSSELHTHFPCTSIKGDGGDLPKLKQSFILGQNCGIVDIK